jgi:protein gp37
MATAEAPGAKPTRKDHYLSVIDHERGRFNGRVELVPEALADPLGWRKPLRVFVNSMSDLFHEGVPFDYVDRVFAVMALTPRHTYQILTKRPERMAEYLQRKTVDDFERQPGEHHPHSSYAAVIETLAENPKLDFRPRGWPLPNVWLGTSVEDQKRADERIPHLLRCPAAIRFLSVEPLLEAVDLDLGDIETASGESGYRRDFINWVIVGGESGPGARPCNVAWIRSIVEQCRAAGVACFVKQLGSNPGWTEYDANCTSMDTGRFVAAKPPLDSKGGDIDEFPADLRVRQFPRTAEAAHA